tara:strand:- start:72 stop:542 length:471 start_codon:yes stop_codon:yes gene_type:complete
MGAGIIPVAFHKNKIFLLFGKEFEDGKWSDFGGGTEKNETPLKTAIREGCEELSGFLGCNAVLARRVKENKLLDLKVSTYHTYLFEIDYDTKLPIYYNNNFQFIRKNFPTALNMNGMFEKSEIRWFNINELRSNLNMFRPWYRNVIHAIISKKDIL